MWKRESGLDDEKAAIRGDPTRNLSCCALNELSGRPKRSLPASVDRRLSLELMQSTKSQIPRDRALKSALPSATSMPRLLTFKQQRSELGECSACRVYYCGRSPEHKFQKHPLCVRVPEKRLPAHMPPICGTATAANQSDFVNNPRATLSVTSTLNSASL